MKNLIKTSIAALVVFVMASSCEKEEVNNVVTERTIKSEEMANNKNEFDEIGKQHNAFLDFYAKNSESASGEAPSVDELINIAKEFYKGDEEAVAALRGAHEILGSVQEEVIAIGGSYRPLDLCKRYPYLCRPGTPPYNPFDILKSSTGSSTDRTIKYINQVKSMEATIINSDEISQDDKMAILAYYSTARHSAAYWHNNLIASANKFWATDDATAQFLSSPGDIIGADADGALVGAHRGRHGGWRGRLIGAVVGGAAASILAATL